MIAKYELGYMKTGKGSSKMDSVDGMESGKKENLEKISKNPDLVHHKYHPAGTGIWIWGSNIVNQRASEWTVVTDILYIVTYQVFNQGIQNWVFIRSTVQQDDSMNTKVIHMP